MGSSQLRPAQAGLGRHVKQDTLAPGSGITISGAVIQTTYQIWQGTQTEYDAIETKDENTIYLITSE